MYPVRTRLQWGTQHDKKATRSRRLGAASLKVSHNSVGPEKREQKAGVWVKRSTYTFPWQQPRKVKLNSGNRNNLVWEIIRWEILRGK